MELWVFVSKGPLYSHLKTQHVVNCCERLHTSANNALRVEKANCPFLESLEVITKLIRKDIVIDLTSILVHCSYTCNVELWCL